MNTINYQDQSILQRPITLPVEDFLSPEEEAQAREDAVLHALSIEEELQIEADKQRQILVASVAEQSKQTRIEIYLAVALENDAVLYAGNQYMLESLKRTQEQNNSVKAYAAYHEANGIASPRF